MPTWTKEELAELSVAIKKNDHNKITQFMYLGQQRSVLEVLKGKDHIFTAVTSGIPDLVEHYAKRQRYDNDTFFNCLLIALVSQELPVIRLFFESSYINFDPNYVLPPNKNIIAKHSEITILIAALIYANQKDGYEEILKFILKKVNVNHSFRRDPIINENALMYAIRNNMKPSLVRLLLNNGADPFQKVTVGPNVDLNVFQFLYANEKHNWANISHASEYIDILKEWKEAKDKGLPKRNSSSEPYSSGSNSPASAGSPEGSPPHHSLLLQKTPPDSPVASRSSSPPSSPMHTSDNSSSGSAGSSPERILSARDHEAHKIIMSRGEIEKIKAIYDTGSITFNCKCSECIQLKINVMRDILRFQSERYISLAKYMLSHPKYPVSINIKTHDQLTYIHWLAKSEVEGDNEPLEKLQNLFLNFGEYHIDVDAKDGFGNTALHLAGANGNAEFISELLKHKADYSIRNNAGLTPYEYASRECKDAQKKSAVLAVMPQVKPSVASSQDKTNGSSTKATVSDARDHELKEMLGTATFNADLEKAKALYDTGKITFNCNCFDCSIVEENVLQNILCYKGKSEVNLAKYMLDHPKYPVDINITNKHKRTFLHLVAKRKFDGNNRPLNHLKNLFLNYGDKYFIDVNAKDKDGNTPLHLAGANGNTELVTELLKHKADGSIKNNEGLFPYDYAARECKDAQNKVAVLAVMPKGSIVVSTPLIARSTQASPSLAATNTRGAPPSVTTSYIESRAGVFSGRQDSSRIPEPIPAQRTQAAQVGAIYVPPPLTHDQLPRPFKKPDMIIMPPEAAPVQSSENKSKSTVANKLKGVFGK